MLIFRVDRTRVLTGFGPIEHHVPKTCFGVPGERDRRRTRIGGASHEQEPDQHRDELIEILQRHGFTVEVHKSWFEYTFMKYGMLWATRKK